ncbi:hypothetical protein K2173_007144 [Erythroxylum novogranatense]|uniref:Senescence domain-containing protein n=1 Tax=Erythroxylum novogranatense TaxID=1862640 RepID=A0AAV8SYP5_9ROSI|nr:hypothetical protein K2173_007144 [Erythroxylum novogranatense]
MASQGIGHENSKQPTDTSMEPNDVKSDGMGIPVERVPEDVSTVPAGTAVVLIKVEGAVISLIDGNSNLDLARDDLYIIKLSQGDDLHTVFVRIGDGVQWMLTKDAITTFKLRDSLYLFKLNLPKESEDVASSSDEENEKDDAANKNLDSDGDNDSDDILMYSLTTEWKGQDDQMKEFDGILQTYSNFEVHETHEQQVTMEDEENVENGSGVKETPSEDKKEIGACQAYYRHIEPNVGKYTSRPAKLVARGSAELIKGILKSGDSTMEMLNWVDQVMKKKMNPNSKSQINPKTLRRIRRVKRMTKTTEKVVTGVLSGVVTATSTFNRMVLETKVAKKFLNFSTGEFVCASFEGFNKVCDAAEEVGKNVLSKSSNVTTSLVNRRYGQEAAEATREGLGAAGHALGTAFAAFSIRKAFDPSIVIKSSDQIGNSNSDVRSARGLRAKLFK